jgi:hypothetical protein
VWGPRCLTLSLHLHHCQGGPPPLNLSSRPERSAAEGPAVSLSGTAKAPWADRLRVPFRHERKLQIPPLRYPGFPVEVGDVGKPHAAFFTESPHTWPRPVLRGRKSGFASVGMTNLRLVAHLGSGGGGGTEPAQQQLGVLTQALKLYRRVFFAHHSVRKAWTGLMEAARCAGITLATSAQNPSAAMEPASTSGSQLFTW